MDKKNEYLRQAIDAQKWADQSKSDKARAGWLRIADQWLSLFRTLSTETKALDRSRSAPDQGPLGPSPEA